jgi:ketosteroid isomerase-like protein
MTIRTTANALLATALLAASAGSLAASPKETLAAFHAALSSGDRAKATSLLAPEVAIYEAGHVERSRDEYAGHHLGGDIEFARNATRKVLKQTERIDGKTAIVWEETETTGTSRGKPVHAFGTETAVLEKNGDGWTIVHVHWSSRKAK